MRSAIFVVAASVFVAGLTGVSVSNSPAQAAEIHTKDSLIRSLSGPKTRGLNTRSLNSRSLNTRSLNSRETAKTRQFRSLVNSLRQKKTRQITVEERTEVANMVKESALPAVDLEIYFEYDSAQLSPQALPKLAVLGQALASPALRGQTFMIAGHTDARGSNGYNQALSERRADTVKNYLVATYGLDPKNLIAIGYGEEQLKFPTNPNADQNRRVQVVNLQQ